MLRVPMMGWGAGCSVGWAAGCLVGWGGMGWGVWWGGETIGLACACVSGWDGMCVCVRVCSWSAGAVVGMTGYGLGRRPRVDVCRTGGCLRQLLVTAPLTNPVPSPSSLHYPRTAPPYQPVPNPPLTAPPPSRAVSLLRACEPGRDSAHGLSHLCARAGPGHTLPPGQAHRPRQPHPGAR